MLIDWFTLGAQAVNLLVLVWLLKRFLYRPILGAVDERERRIAAQLKEAAATKADAEKERDEYRQKNVALDAEREERLRQAAADAQAERERLIGEARTEVEALRVRWRAALVTEQQTLGADIGRRVQAEVFAIARKTLAELAGTELEASVTEVFVRRLRDLNAVEKGQLKAALEWRGGPACVRTAFDLQPAQKEAIETAVREILAVGTAIQFETVPEGIGGLELMANGHKVTWSIADYVGSLERQVREAIEEHREPVSHAGRNADEPVG